MQETLGKWKEGRIKFKKVDELSAFQRQEKDLTKDIEAYNSAYAQPGLAPNGLALSWLLWKLLWRSKTELEIKQFQNAGCTK